MPIKTIGQLCSIRNTGKPKKEKVEEKTQIKEIIEEEKPEGLKLINGKIVMDTAVVKQFPVSSSKSHQKK